MFLLSNKFACTYIRLAVCLKRVTTKLLLVRDHPYNLNLVSLDLRIPLRVLSLFIMIVKSSPLIKIALSFSTQIEHPRQILSGVFNLLFINVGM